MGGVESLIEERALELGFAALGIVEAGPPPDAPRLVEWLEAGRHGEMAWMEKHLAIRLDARTLEPGTRTGICVTIPYGPRGPVTADPMISRYAQGEDYHTVVRARLLELGQFVRREAGGGRCRPTVDSAPIFERSWAQAAGLGWVGKSAMLIRQGHGTHTFLAGLWTSAELEPRGTPQPDRCGTCVRCMVACPTGAITGPGQVDARRCISYLTIELRGPIPRALRPLIGHRLYGCDVCQDVCPWNAKVRTEGWREFDPRPNLSELDGAVLDAARILRLTAHEFNTLFEGSPIVRTKRRGLARNAAVVLGNSGDTLAVPVLAEALESHDEWLVRGHAAWALGRLGTASARSALMRANLNETHEWVREEITVALEPEDGA